MGESVEELDSLFDYSRVQPAEILCIDDDDSDSSPPKRKKISGSSDDKEEKTQKGPSVMNLVNEEEEEDWLPPPPKFNTDVTAKLVENSTLKELRLRKQELLSFAQSAKRILEDVDESAKNEVHNLSETPLEATSTQPSVPPCERVKIVLSIQDKNGTKQFRVYADEKFEKLFKLYADKCNLGNQTLAFIFDGDKINPAATPESLGMEDDDIIEVHAKSS